jgi:uncharacterized repeat protein (TIGR03806 family)
LRRLSLALLAGAAACAGGGAVTDSSAPDASADAGTIAGDASEDAATVDTGTDAGTDAGSCTPGGDGTYLDGWYPKLSSYCLVEISNGRAKPLAGVPYDLNTPLFSDGATKVRTIWMPPGTHATYSATTAFAFPTGTIITKSFGFADDPRSADPTIRWIETRLLVKTSTAWRAIAYVWNADMSDADRSYAGGVRLISFIDETGTPTIARYAVPNANQCRSCHAPGGIMDVIGPKARNLNRVYPYEDGAENQLVHLTRAGLLTGAPADPTDAPALPVWNDPTTGSTTARARAYLEVNCAHCHNGGSGDARPTGLVLWASEIDPVRYGVCKSPVAAGPASGGFFYDVVPGDPDHSVLPYRMAITGMGLMPPLSRSLVHHTGVRLVRDWIRGLPGRCGS